jgi:hypothetical protein
MHRFAYPRANDSNRFFHFCHANRAALQRRPWVLVHFSGHPQRGTDFAERSLVGGATRAEDISATPELGPFEK